MDKVSVSTKPLRELLGAVLGGPHLIRELQVLYHSPIFKGDNPIKTLVDEFNASFEDRPEEEDPNLKRLRHVYQSVPRTLFTQSFEDWLQVLDSEITKQGDSNDLAVS